ncbi:MAG: 2-oxo acid dehydrogenase subunit E2 [Phycisphaerales bacterium]|nr:MAG: 2-oxo acid dehydrogenase subunit E2 [Phycisphaerales bacterium]
MAGKVSSDPNVFLLPDIGEGLQEAEVIKWLVSEGDEVEENQALAEVQTDKALTEIPSPRAGKIAKLHGADGDVMKVGAPFVSYVGAGGAAAEPKAPPAKNAVQEEEREDAGTVVGQMSGDLAGVSRAEGKALATPAVRRLARDLGVDIDSVKGTGIGGRVTKRDVEAAKSGAGTPNRAAGTTTPRPEAPERGTSRRPLPSQPAQPQAQRPAPQPQQPNYQQPYPQQGYPQQGYAQPYPQAYPQPYPQHPMMMPGYAPYPPYMMPMPWGYMPQMPQMPPMPGMHPGMQGGGIPTAPGFTPFPSGRPVPPPAQVSSVEPGAGTASVPFKGVRRVIAGKLRQSVDTAVHFTVMDEADVTALDDLRRRLAAESGRKLSFLPFIASAVCRALSGPYGALNARVDDERDEIVQHEAVHLGIATDTDSGLMVPVLRDADRADVFTLSDQIATLAATARDRSIPREQLTGSTFTISNVGSHAGRFATPVINYPEVGIIAVGKAYDGVVVRDGQPMVAKLMPLSLACDHRVVDGATAALCLAEIVRLLQEPEQLV